VSWRTDVKQIHYLPASRLTLGRAGTDTQRR
jgi:hypothetical protein